MKKYFGLAAMLLIACFAVSCSDDDENTGTVSKNRIYLSIEGNNTLAESSDDAITVNVELSRKVSADLTLNFAIDNNEEGIVSIVNNPLTIAKGTTSGQLTIKSNKLNLLEETTTMTLALPGLDTEKYTLTETARIFVTPSSHSSELTPEQKALIEHYKQTLGVDLTPWMGAVSLKGTIEFPGGGYRAPFVESTTINLTGTTNFTLSNNSDAESMVLKMENNPMGMEEYLYSSLRKQTVEDNEYFCDENAAASLDLMNILNWNATSNETFTVSLDNLLLTDFDPETQTANINFVTEGTHYILDKNGNHIYSEMLEDDLVYNYAESWIPFEYSFTAWDRMLDLVAENNPEIMEIMVSYTSAPYSYLGMLDVLTDSWGIDEEEDGVPNLYVEPKGTIDFANGTMTFEFPFDHADQYGYSRVKVTYSLQK